MDNLLLLPEIDIQKEWRKTFLGFFRLKKSPSDAWIIQFIRILNRKYKNKHDVQNPYIYQNKKIYIQKYEYI